MARNSKHSLPDNATRPATSTNRAACARNLTLFACLSFCLPCLWGQTHAPGASTSIDSVSSQNAPARPVNVGVAPMPLGVAPPPGQSWHLQTNDTFDQDESINQTLWNGGTGGGMPPGFCKTPATSCGYTGDDCNSYFGTYPEPPYETIAPGVGLAIQATHAAPGDLKYYDNKMADLQNYGKLTLHAGSYVEWVAKMPTDHQGEGDGWHVDLWCSTLSRNRCDDSSEVDIAEKILSVGNSSKTTYVVHDQPMGLKTVIEVRYSAPGSPDLSAGFHTYGIAWRNDHSGKQGSLEGYIDGKPIVDHPVPINDPSWGSGVYCYAGWMQQELGEVWGGGASIDSHTARKNPLFVKRFTLWKAY